MLVFEVFLVRIFPHTDWIRRFVEWISLFSPNSGKCWPEKLWIQTLFTQCVSYRQLLFWRLNHFSNIHYRDINLCKCESFENSSSPWNIDVLVFFDIKCNYIICHTIENFQELSKFFHSIVKQLSIIRLLIIIFFYFW